MGRSSGAGMQRQAEETPGTGRKRKDARHGELEGPAGATPAGRRRKGRQRRSAKRGLGSSGEPGRGGSGRTQGKGRGWGPRAD